MAKGPGLVQSFYRPQLSPNQHIKALKVKL